jgi:polyisoprenoid-binding protein YceI
MKKLITQLANYFLIGLFLVPAQLHAQNPISTSQTQVKVKGTSTLHDWEMSSSKAQVKGSLKWEQAKLVEITSLQVQIVATTLKSDNSGLDKNAYKALMTDKFSQIQFVLQQATLTPATDGTYKVVGNGQLTIAGQSKKVTLHAVATVQADKSVQMKGSTSFNMSEYGVKPPTVMMGTIKTGDKITIEYNIKLQSN